ncbi:MAG: hypothetical protein C4538_09250 [Nitrospiraceae bacterium]|nr:MAG: hypothetical protein C4538_09250 [Nitrospiraceae bacterium]
MKKRNPQHLSTSFAHFFAVLLFLLIIPCIPADGYAIDQEGCLTCHRYPGLVKYEKLHEVRVLHIDEGKHLDSPHGKVDCRECHPQINQIPHTGEREIDCTTRCHLNDREKIRNIAPAALDKYHENEKFSITRLDDKSSCRVCHPLYPHSQNKKVRAFLNMHTGFMLCEVCHLKKETLQDLTYEWKEPESFAFTGEPYGTHQKIETTAATHNDKGDNFVTKMLKILSPKSNKPATVKKEEYLISRLAVFSSSDAGKKLLMNTSDNERAGKFLEREKGLSQNEQDVELKYFHRDIARKAISVACNDCHSPKGILDFRKVGFDEKRAKDLEYLNIKSLITKYETFYLPNLFGH